MPKIAFLGAGSTVFARNILGDSLLSEALRESEFALFDIDPQRLKDSEMMLNNLNKNTGGHGKVVAYTDRKAALRGADYVICAVQIGGYEPSKIDFEIPKKYGLRQISEIPCTGIFRALRTLPVFQDFARDMEEVCPDAWFLNYVNCMAILTGYMQRFTGRNRWPRHSVQGCATDLLKALDMPTDNIQWKIAGINPWRGCWRSPVTAKTSIQPKRRAAARTGKHNDMVRYEIEAVQTMSPNLASTMRSTCRTLSRAATQNSLSA